MISWFGRLAGGLKRSAAVLSGGIGDIFARRRLDEAALEELGELLISADLGVAFADDVVETLRRERFGKDVAPEEVRGFLADRIAGILDPVATPLAIDPANRPHVILVTGVNGSGKTTTIGKLARRFRDEGRTVMLAAGDTFRAAAIEQLEIWGARTGCEVVTTRPGGDASGLAFDAMKRARAAGVDVLMIDTAGRLHNRAELMDELAKVVRVIRKQDPAAPHDTLLVLDASTGQNALEQIRVFSEITGVSGLVMTKLDGSAKGGVLVAAAARFGLPIHAVGVGEAVEDLRPFEPRAFARALVGLAEAE